MSLACEITSSSIKLGMLRVTTKLLSEIREDQKFDSFLSAQLQSLAAGRESSFRVGSDGVLRFQDRMCVPSVPKIRRAILEEGHRSSLSIHSRETTMYQDLRQMFWWPSMKREVNEFVLACLVCQKAKIEHQKP